MNKKDSLLKILENNRGNYISGEVLALEIGISRSMIWKLIGKLKIDGHNIKSVHNKGYMLNENNDVISAEGIGLLLNDKSLIEKICVYDSVGSTNHIAKRNILDNLETKIIVANEQIQGKGRNGRNFYSPPNTGVYMSIILDAHKKKQEEIMKVTALASVAVSRAILNVSNINVDIKWVNDVYINNKKVCGILTEAIWDMESRSIDNVVVGIGINVTLDEYIPEDLKNIVGSICKNGEYVNRNKLIAEIINQINAIWESGDESFLDEYRRKSMVIGKSIKIHEKNSTTRAFVLDIDDNAHLIVKLENGEIKKLSSGEISIRLEKKNGN